MSHKKARRWQAYSTARMAFAPVAQRLQGAAPYQPSAAHEMICLLIGPKQLDQMVAGDDPAMGTRRRRVSQVVTLDEQVAVVSFSGCKE